MRTIKDPTFNIYRDGGNVERKGKEINREGILKLAKDEAFIKDKIRYSNIKSIKFIDEVYLIRNSIENFIQKIKPDAVVKGFEYKNKFNNKIGISEPFKNLFTQGMVCHETYKDEKNNWLAPDEIESENGKDFFIEFTKDKKNSVIVATTRPETMLGDTAVAVHPQDKRYSDLVGKTLILPLVNREIPVIADEYSDPDKGSGAVKITPGHDFNDFEVGRRHNLEIINIFDENACIVDKKFAKNYIYYDII